MPKRNYSEIEKITRKLRKLEKKLEQVKRKQSPTLSLLSEDPTLCLINNTDTNDVIDEVSVELPGPPDEPAQQLPVSPAQPQLDAVEVDQVPLLTPSDLEGTKGLESSVKDLESQTTNVDDDFIHILGDDPSQATEYGKDIHCGLATRLEYLTTNGLGNDIRKDLRNKYLIPANCRLINAPLLNPEIKAALPELSLKRDKAMEKRQKQLSTAIACLSELITIQIQEKDKNSPLLKQCMDAIKLLCDTIHSDSVKRRYFISSSLKKDINNHLMKNKIDEYLFGENLAETLRTAKAVSKSSADIKLTQNKNNNRRLMSQTQPSTSRSLNWSAPPPTHRQSGPQRSRQPLPPATAGMPRLPPPPTHAASSRTYRAQPRQTRRR